MANKTFNTRVKNKRDTAANWEAVATTFQPLDGELIIVDTSAGKTRFKVGRYDTAKGRLLYYNEIPFADEYLYNDLNESQGKIYDKLKGIDDKSIIEMTLESVFDNTKFVNYRIGLWQFPKTGFYKLNIAKRGTTATQLFLYAQKTKEDGTTPEDPFSQDNLLRISPLTGDKQVESVFVQVDYTDTDTLTVYKVQFLNVMTFPGTININTYNKTTQKWDFTSVTESSAKWANNATQVSNALTLTKGDTTTKFDGSTAQTVSIPTKTSELTNDSNFTTQTDLDNLTNNVVSYNAQENITDEQKATARTNIGATFEPFKVTLSRTYGKPYLDKTPKEINDAYTAGKYVYLQGPFLLPLTRAIRSGDEKYTISFSGTSKVSEDSSIQVASFSVINVTPDYSGQWTENYKYNIDAKVFELDYNPSTNEVSGSNPYNSIATLNYSGSGQTAVVQLYVNNNKLYLNQVSTIDSNTFIFQGLIGDEMLILIIASNSMQIQALHIINENNIKNIVDQSYVAFYTEQSLSDEEKKQARNNIGAASPSDLVQSDWNQNDTSSPAYVQNRPGGYYNSIASAESGTLSTTDFQDASAEFSTTSYIVTNEAFNTNLTNLKIAVGKTYKMSWVDSNKEYSYIANAVEINDTKNNKFTVILGDTTLDFTHNKLIWGSKSKVIFILNGGTVTSANTVTNIKIEEVNITKIPEEFLDLSSVPEGFDLSKNYTAEGKGSLKYTSSLGGYIIIGFNEENVESNKWPIVEVSMQELDTSYVATTQYAASGIHSSWKDSSTNNFIHGIDINYDRYNKALILQSKLTDNTTKDLAVRGIATPTADNDAATKKYVDDKFLGEEVLVGGISTKTIDVSTPASGSLLIQVGSTNARLGAAQISADSLDMGETLISNVKTPVNDNDVATKGYVDSREFQIDDGAITKAKLAADLLNYLDGEMITSDTWTYIKKDSGLVIAWSSNTVTLEFPANADVNATIAKKYPDGLFISTPICIPYLHGPQSFYQYNKKAGTPTWTPELGIHNLGDAAAAVKVTVDFFVIGKWK